MENVLYMHPAILEAAFNAMPDEKWSEAVKAVVVLKGGPQGHRGGDHRLLQGNIAHYKAPKSVDFIRELPKTASGKIYKRGLWISTGGRRGKGLATKMKEAASAESISVLYLIDLGFKHGIIRI